MQNFRPLQRYTRLCLFCGGGGGVAEKRNEAVPSVSTEALRADHMRLVLRMCVCSR